MYKYLLIFLAYSLFGTIFGSASSTMKGWDFSTGESNTIEEAMSKYLDSIEKSYFIFNTMKELKKNQENKNNPKIRRCSYELDIYLGIIQNKNVPTLFGAMSYTPDEGERINLLIEKLNSYIERFKSELDSRPFCVNQESTSNLRFDEGQEGFAITEEKTIEGVIGLSISKLEQNFNFILKKEFLTSKDKQRINQTLTKFIGTIDYLLTYNQNI